MLRRGRAWQEACHAHPPIPACQSRFPRVRRTCFRGAGDSFASFLNGVRAEARAAGIRPATLDRAFAGVAPNQKVLERDRHQPEFTMTWARYRALVITDKRITDGRQAVAANRALFQRVEQRYGVGSGVIAGIWGLESSFGTGTGDFRVVEALATLAWEGRRASFFRGELMAALKILDHGDVAPGAMTGSYAGAMGQPQFMPTSYLRYAVDFEGQRPSRHLDQQAGRSGLDRQLPGRSRAGAAGQTWGQAVSVPAGMDAPGRDAKRPIAEWARAGVRPVSGRWAASRRHAGRPGRAGWGRGRSLPGLRQLRRHPPLQPVRLLCHRGRPDRRPGRDVTSHDPSPACGASPSLVRRPARRRSEPDPHYVLGKPYQVGSIWFYPRESFDLDETGIACHRYRRDSPRLTTDGEVFDQTALAAAHPTIQLPAIARLTNLENGREVTVRVNDRGSGDPHRLVEVTSRTAALLDIPPDGVARVRLRVLTERKPRRGRGASRRTVPGHDRRTARRRGGRRTAPPPGIRQGNGRRLPENVVTTQRRRPSLPPRPCGCPKRSPRRSPGPAS